MFLVKLEPNRDRLYQPLTVNASEYLYGFASAIARAIPDAEVHATLGSQRGDEVVFHGSALDDESIDLF
ncbi:hypothetical protein [Magnetospirillum sp. UT-4]|uniref:hypothetical protein n=1 Tax=Magnetospirillum sp. UT-4 TaxID=2681467 RepID=UPI00137D5018|nr:hypothetical protein [Magnetospirillum sp. UT-4]CAA7621998.1 conserved hypothetical protein [Magnetospirillum sp. UT-4]